MARLSALSRQIAGQTAIVTGAASGIGRATAHLFADEGARVAVTDLEESKVQAVVEEIRTAGGEAHGWVMDVRDQDTVDYTIASVASHFETINILINNAGITGSGAIDDPDYSAIWDRTLSTLLTADTLTVRAVLPYLRAAGNGRIVNIASTEGLGATKNASAYSAAKTGVIGLTRALAVELGPEGITVNCVCPGPIHTGMTAAIPNEAKEKFARRRVALGRYAQPEEVAHGILSLVLPAASYITGVALPVDGGLTIRNA